MTSTTMLAIVGQDLAGKVHHAAGGRGETERHPGRMANACTISAYAYDDSAFSSNMQWYLALTILCAIIIGALIAHLTLYLLLSFIAEQTITLWDDVVVAYSKWPLLPLLPLTALYTAVPLVFPGIDRQLLVVLHRIIGVFLIISAYWLMSNLSKGIVHEYLRGLQRVSNGPPPPAKDLTRVKTTLMLLKRSWEVVCGVFCAIGVVMVLPGADQIGAWLYASVSLVGAFVGVAVRPFMRSLLNAVQLSVTQPFSLGDDLTVDGFRGVVEEIAWDYVVLAQDDDCRRIIPIERLLSIPYETRARSPNGVCGHVQLWVDFKSDVQQWRMQLVDLCGKKGRPDWDGRVAKVAVTDCTPAAKELTFTVSARDWPSLERLNKQVIEALCLSMSGHSNPPPPPPTQPPSPAVAGSTEATVDGCMKQAAAAHSSSLPRHRTVAVRCRGPLPPG
ncbi:hypothetical protein SYNPS1DRAFT_28859 [Syncephalis pseudoplumigaleata]|uniref:Mechanosensitive ion channel MscS domain-containing protein n=1 Tax=Syncephalis pseudoplumigaleata TaxID=1712513 RepID=A0A4P9Z0L2_9FUNG|nr:hypothetical protein SYNPS1DRAFT_28859 [Syncephalis pseudoplumigaleata]|eukprot:RKP25412.1 hypothetical protein SYNPS1DRAFT_28859 [Syncephalis pseudoplumigaleata]